MMEILSPSPPPSPCPAVDSQLHRRLRCGGSRREHRSEAWVHVAVGRSPEKTLGLLRWTLRRFQCGRIALLHVHQPSPLIPTLLGKIPAGQATEELVLSHRKSEKEEMNKILLTYLAFCHRAQVQATLLVTENDQIHDGILTLVNQHGVTKLVMGSTPDHCFKLKPSYGKESLMVRNAPAFCEIWFVWRGRHIWTREASSDTDNRIQDDLMTTKRIRFTPYGDNVESILDEGYIAYQASIMADLKLDIVPGNDGLNDCDALEARECNHFYNMGIANWRDAETELNSTFWSDSSVHMETVQLYSTETLDRNIKEVMIEAEGSRKEAFVELLKRKETESDVASAFSRAKVSDSARKQEMRTREELEILLASTRKQHEELVKNKERVAAGLKSSMGRLAILDARTATISLRMCEAAAELEVIQSSIETLRQEKTKVQDTYGLASEVRRAMSCDKLSSVLDKSAGDWPMEVAGRLAEFGIKCSEASSRDRPELTPEMVRDLERLHLKREKHVPSSFLCPILKEIMHDPQVCADGFSYERRVIQEWMENGRETSPVTNQKLAHRNLTPNYALRFAIQDWLSSSNPLLKM
ncbi:hypothetical protein QOZ80_8BG0665160 [Eleusine coracana subsp. coracana]|nr:hypothetical protein QOZ80_8BG0665160 [Eleusine coracana subsp. coracana]